MLNFEMYNVHSHHCETNYKTKELSCPCLRCSYTMMINFGCDLLRTHRAGEFGQPWTKI